MGNEQEKPANAVSGLNSIGEDAYFIRLKDKPKTFVHYEGDNPKNPEKEVVYRMKEGAVGAAIFKKEQADNFIKLSNANNLETVHAKDIIGGDASKN